MARIRKFCAYRRLERAYTRKSKYKTKSFVRASPNIKVVRFDMGELKDKFQYSLSLVSGADLQIRHNAIEAARLTSNRVLEKKLGKSAYYMKIKIFPHHILRENPLASGAGADRMSTGMKMSFGKPIGIAARVRKGQVLFEVKCNKSGLETAKEALKKASQKIPCSCKIEVQAS